VALDGIAEGWVTVERKVALPPPPRRAVRGIRSRPLGHLHRWHHHVHVSSPLLLAPPSLSLPPLISVLVHCARCRVPWHADNGSLKRRWCSAVSSGGSGGSSLKRDGGGARRQQRLPRRASVSRARSGANVPRSGL
jgi:hypothetical protein